MCSESSSGAETLCNIEDTISNVLEPIIEGEMNLAGVEVAPEGQRDPNGTFAHEASTDGVGAETAAAGAAVVAAGVGRLIPVGKKDGGGDKPASTPTDSRGSPVDVAPGTNAPGNVGGREFTGHAFDQM